MTATNREARPPRPGDPREAALICAAAALERKGEDLVLMDVAELTGYTDYFLLVSGRSTRQTKSMAEYIRRVMKNRGVKPLGENGLNEGRWALLDFGDVVVHVFHQPVREFYDLESLWADAPRVDLDPAELEALLSRKGEPATDIPRTEDAL